MTERPILFSTPMVRALLEGRKTQTRRIVKDQPAEAATFAGQYHGGVNDTRWDWMTGDPADCDTWGYLDAAMFTCPYGKPGDRLWVRETWRPYSWRPNELTLQMRADNAIVDVELPDTNEAEAWLDRICEESARECEKQALDEEDGIYVWDGEEENPIRWRPSIFMPRWASRITLEITEVRVQRLQEISEEDAIAEGVEAMTGQCAGCFVVPMSSAMSGTTAKECYSRLWESIHGRGSWVANEWVWALTFKMLEVPTK